MVSTETTPLLQRSVSISRDEAPCSSNRSSVDDGARGLRGPRSHRWNRHLNLRRQSLAGTQVETNRLSGFSSFVFLSNLITGPGMLAFPAAYQQGGWLTGIVFTGFFTFITGICSGYLVYAWRKYQDQRDDALIAKSAPLMQTIMSREAFQPELDPDSTKEVSENTLDTGEEEGVIEYEALVRDASPGVFYIIFQILFLFAMVVMTVSSICVVARELDNLSIITFGNAFGLQMSPSIKFVPSCRSGEECRTREAFQDTDDIHGMVISQGYMVTLLITLPLSLIEIADWFQITMYFISLVCLLQLIAAFAYIVFDPTERVEYVHQPVPALNYNVGLVMEVCFWAWAISFATPMWLSSKGEGVSASKPLWWACIHRGVLDVLLGLSGAFAFPGLDTLNVLDELRLRPDVSSFTRICGVVFAVSSILPNVVDYAMAASRNLQAHTGVLWANVLSVGIPFSLSWVFYFGAAFNVLVNATSTFLGGLVQFVVPALLFLYYIRKPAYGEAQVVGLRASLKRWRWMTITLIVVVSLMVVGVYTLNVMVSQGFIGPMHAIKEAEHKDAEDYSAYAAYNDEGEPPNTANPPPPVNVLDVVAQVI